MRLTLVIVNDGQKDRKLLDYCFRALATNDLTDVQVMLLQQAVNGSYARDLAAKQPFKVEVFESAGEIIDGVRLWDVMADLKAMRPKMTGEYLLYIHKEFILPPDYLSTSLAFLAERGPDIARGNLMRLGSRESFEYPIESSCRKESAKLKRAITAGRPFPELECIPWIFSREPKPDRWVEDVFFARLAWLDQVEFFGQCDRLLFQDIFDCVTAIDRANRIYCPQVPGRMFHLWHEKGYHHFSDAVIEHFESNPQRWRGTCFFDIPLLRRIQAYLANPNPLDNNPIHELRQGKNGTVTRYAKAFSGEADEHFRKTTPLLIASAQRYRNKDNPEHAIAAFLESVNCRTRWVQPEPQWPLVSFKPDFAAIWNGGKKSRAEAVRRFRENGTPVLIMEHGWLDRHNYTQLDWQGYNHRASWAKDISGPAPIEGVGRFGELQAIIGERTPVEARKDGYVLILGQTPGDHQLGDSEIHHADALVEIVRNSTTHPIAFRGHPRCKWRPNDIQSLECDLDEAIAGARFCLTINSNSGNEALWAGCPVLCLGPSLYEMAGVAMGTSVARMSHDIEMMLHGWAPDDRRVLSYFHWLCARQWSNAELASGEPLRKLLSEMPNGDI